jgi:hypothetical protein
MSTQREAMNILKLAKKAGLGDTKVPTYSADYLNVDALIKFVELLQASETVLSGQGILVEMPKAQASEPVGFCRSDVLDWKGQTINAAMMHPSPKGLLNPVALYTSPPNTQAKLDKAREALQKLKPINVRVAKDTLERVAVYPASEVDAILKEIE